MTSRLRPALVLRQFQSLVNRTDARLFALVLSNPPFRRWAKPEYAPVVPSIRFLFRYVRFWLLIWVAVYLIDPELLGASKAGLQTILQVIPAALVAVLVFAIGAIFAIIQSLVSTYGMRAALLVPLDARVAIPVLRPLVLLSAALLLAGQVPDTGHPPNEVAATAAVLVLASISAILATTMALPAAFTAFLAPVNFVAMVREGVEVFFESEALGMVGFRLGLLEQMLGASLRRGDTFGSRTAVETLGAIHQMYMRSVADHPSNRTYHHPDGTDRVGWFGADLGAALSRAGEQYLATPGTEDLYVDVSSVLHAAGVDFASHGLDEESSGIITAQIRLATSIHQMGPTGVVNNWADAASGLAAMEAAAEASGHRQIATRALAGWAVATAYVMARWERMHPQWVQGIRAFGPDPPFGDAAALIESDEYSRQWGTKMPQGPLLVVGNLGLAADAVEHRDDPSYVPIPFRPAEGEAASSQ